MSVEEAYQRIIEGKGTQFDPISGIHLKKYYPVWKELHINLHES